MSLSGMLFAVALLFQGVDETGTAIARPIGEAYLEPTTGSYFQIFEFYGRPPHTWAHAKEMVRGYYHEGREGRLAHVKSQTVHYFLLVKFPMVRQHQMWIGLSATCNEKADINWLDGSSIKEQAFRAWNDGTQRTISRTCRSRKESGDVLPVFYDPHELGTRWEAGAAGKNLRYMIAEFPVPVEEPEAKTVDQAEAEQPVG
mgnify:CR=1 FL=1